MRIAIVNDLDLAVRVLSMVLEQQPQHELAWVAKDGQEAVARCGEDRPDLILMDLVMPVMDGVEATRLIMEATPCAVLVVTATVEGHASMVFEAMGWGALDAVATPTVGHDGGLEGADLLLKKIATIQKLIGQQAATTPAPPAAAAAAEHLPPLAVIGASTGGPRALAVILGALPAAFPGALVLVQHIDEAFSGSLAQWLDAQTKLEVAVAVEGMQPAPGRALLAVGPEHLVLRDDLTLGYTPEPRDQAHMPAIDVFFRSTARCWPRPGVAALLTGMGRDGADGLLALRQSGWHTIAQDEATSAVFGMPRIAVDRGAARAVLPLDEIAPVLERRLRALIDPRAGAGAEGEQA